MSAFGFLAVRTAVNWSRVRLRRLRQPRYALALVAGIAYFAFIFSPDGARRVPPPEFGITMGTAAAIFTFLTVSFWWIMKADPRALAFSDAETHLLFPAPVTRSMLIAFKLLRGQLPVILNVLLFTFVFLRRNGALDALLGALGLWVLFTTLYLHRLAAAVTRLGASTRTGAAIRTYLPGVAVGGVFAVIGLEIARALPPLLAEGNARAAATGLVDVLRTGVAGAVLLPFHLLTAPAFSPPDAWVRAFAGALVLLALHVVWVFRADVALEDAAVAAARREAERKQAEGGAPARSRSKWRLPRLPLPPRGRPEIALLWKNGVPILDAINPVVVLLLAGAAVLLAFLLAGELPVAISGRLIIALGALIAALFAMAFGPFALRQDLRGDLPRLDLLRTFPLSGESIVRMEILSTALPLALLQVALLAAAFTVSLGAEGAPLPLRARMILTVGAALTLPAVTLASVTVQNTAALLFPDWVRLGSAERGVEAMGQMMLVFAASAAALLALLVVPLIAGLLAILATSWIPRLPLLAGSLVFAIAVLFEIRLLVTWLGRVFERTDPVEAGLSR